MSYATARAMTTGELSAVRLDGQWTKVRMIIVPQQVVLACKASGSLVNDDAVQSISITSITSGSTSLVQSGMTCYVGSGSGLDDLGMVRVKACTSAVMTFARVSGIDWSSDTHLTVVDDFGLWHKLPVLDTEATTTAIMMDDNVVYTDQNTNIAPVPVFGPDCAFSFVSGSILYDGSNSWCPDTAEEITAWEWTAMTGGYPSPSLILPYSGSGVSSASCVSGSVVAFKPPAPGSYTIGLKVTASNGAYTTGHRSVYVYDDGTYAPIEQVQLTNLMASREEGGWQADVTVWEGALPAQMRDRAKVILLGTDYYGGSNVPMGQVSGREEVLFVGWIADEQTEYDSEYSTVKLSIKGPQYWLQQTVGPSTFLENIEGTPDVWTSMNNLTLDKVAWHFLYWRSTAVEVIDCYPSLNTRIIGGMSASIGSIWEQIAETAKSRMLSYLCCDRFGRLFIYVDPQVIPSASRTSIPEVMTLTKSDITEKIGVKRTIVNPVSLLEVAGLAASGSQVLMYMSRAPGSLIYNRFGQNDQNDRLVVSSQADANSLSGLLLAKKNNMYSQVNMTLGQNNKMIDVGPPMYVKFTVDASDTIRGFSFTEKRFLINSINYRVNDKAGSVTVDLELEGETTGIDGYTVIVPQEPIYVFPGYNDNGDYDITYPDFPDIDFPVIDYDPFPFIPIPVSGSPGYCPTDAPLNGPYNLNLTATTIYSGSVIASTARIHNANYTMRSASHDHPTILYLYGRFEYLSGTWEEAPYNANQWWYVNALDYYGNTVATGALGSADEFGYRYAVFGPTDPVEIYGFEVGIYAYQNSGSAGGYRKEFTFDSGKEGWMSGSGIDGLISIDPGSSFVPNYLSAGGGDLVMATTYPPSNWWNHYGTYVPLFGLTAVTGGSIVAHTTGGGFEGAGLFLGTLDNDGKAGGTSMADPATITYTVTAGQNGLPILGAFWDSTVFRGFELRMSDFTITGMTSTVVQYRIKLDNAILYNVCPPS